jgi:signal transduction histidine kinase
MRAKTDKAYAMKAGDSNRSLLRRRTAQLENSNEELRLLASRLAMAEEHERRRIAKQVNDGIGQSMSLCSIQLGRLLHSSTSDALTERLKEIQTIVKDVLEETRAFVFEVSPAVLYDFGLEVAVKRLAAVLSKRHGIRIDYEDDGQSKGIDDDAQVMLFQMTRELLDNAVKHAHAHEIKVTTVRRGDSIRITVRDDGVGFDVKTLTLRSSGGVGLFSVRERLRQIGGSAKITSGTGTGTVVTLSAPLRRNSARIVTTAKAEQSMPGPTVADGPVPS